MGVEIRATVAEKRPESPHAATLRLDLHGVPFSYRPGQYILIDPHQFSDLSETLAKLEGGWDKPEAPRAFSLCSDALDSGSVEITVKENPRQGEYGMLLAPLLVRRIGPGDPIRFSGPGGRYALPESPPAGVSGFLHVCAGSGAAPNRGMIRHALAKGWPQKHLLICQDRHEEDVLFKQEWEGLLARHPDLLRIRRAFSAERGERLDVDGVRDSMNGWFDGPSAMAFVCGPGRPRGTEPGFVETWAGLRAPGRLQALGFTPDRILTELW